MLPLLHRARSGYTGLMAKASVPKGVINFDDINGGKGVSQSVLYSHGWGFARWTKDEGLIGVTLNPGNLRLPFQRYANYLENTFNGIFLHPPIFGASTGLLARLSPEINSQTNGGYIIPWGRSGYLEKKVAAGHKEESEGGTGIAKEF